MEEVSKSIIMRFSHVDTFFHSFNFFAFDVPVFSAQGIRSPPSPLRLSSLTDSTNGFNRVIKLVLTG